MMFGGVASTLSLHIIAHSIFKTVEENEFKIVQKNFLVCTGISLTFIGLSYFLDHVIDKSNSRNSK